ncbi:Gfo/Idh/MocA family protein [Streptomyces sp. NPDC057424]|uniref:Gfo/Idh/MocA family protein n=1 Tax=Streptomyces sp. NPDC057424 TaxID=3346127 RepID=UPI0036B85EF3
MRWGIAGCGEVVERRVLPALRVLAEQAVCVWGRNAAHAREIADRHGVPGSTADLAAMLEEVDAVYVATPVATHVPLALEAVRTGRHVLIEKPLGGALPVPSAALAALARERRICAGVAYYRRLAPAVIRLGEILPRDVPRQATVHFCTPFDPAPADPKFWRTDPRVAGGGVQADAGSHRIDLLCRLLGVPDVVAGRLLRPFAQGAERTAVARLSWPSGDRADCLFAWAAAGSHDRFSLSFDGGSATLDPLDAGRLRWRASGREYHETLPPDPNPHVALITDFVRRAREGGDPICSVEEAMAVDAIIAAARDSSVLSAAEAAPRKVRIPS